MKLFESTFIRIFFVFQASCRAVRELATQLVYSCASDVPCWFPRGISWTRDKYGVNARNQSKLVGECAFRTTIGYLVVLARTTRTTLAWFSYNFVLRNLTDGLNKDRICQVKVNTSSLASQARSCSRLEIEDPSLEKVAIAGGSRKVKTLLSNFSYLRLTPLFVISLNLNFLIDFPYLWEKRELPRITNRDDTRRINKLYSPDERTFFVNCRDALCMI